MDSAPKHLEGLTLDEGWKVISKLPNPPQGTGGNFSICYIVENKETNFRGFLKALDITRAFREEDPLRVIQDMTEAFNYERDLLNTCKEGRMSRVVTALVDGKIDVPGYEHPRVNYLIFELADQDVRKALSIIDKFDNAWRLRSLHHVTIGLHQLHNKGIAHQDLKPSNVLVFKEKGSKIGDLGRASERGKTSPFDHFVIPGDSTYYPPEILYSQIDPDWVDRRLGCDVYLLGSLVMFFFTGVSVTPAIMNKLNPQHKPQEWGGDFASVLPFIRDSWDEVMTEFEKDISNLPETLLRELVITVRQLTEPDPTRRGHPKNVINQSSQFTLERYISLFDRLARRAEYDLF